ncbi:protein eva-1 homolog C isoform X2 [Denticeps clupeoides]|uniref:protein eva-1 homolog C isoform X2 n=1 Tax=Denticeps clupeoides TaxID=299321 RepID=UPI0010A4D13F|nr:protein eva-1 homolog C-like isoform X2 [Denticeps clupeoides]
MMMMMMMTTPRPRRRFRPSSLRSSYFLPEHELWGRRMPARRARLLPLLCGLLLLRSAAVPGLSDFSGYLSKLLGAHSAAACDGDLLRLRCPRHATISVLAATYGRAEGATCPAAGGGGGGPVPGGCRASSALQKLLAECQGHRDCRVPVLHRVFGRDPCPGRAKHLHVSYRCKPTEHKAAVGCEGDTVKLHCKPPRALLIYSAFYGRRAGQDHACGRQRQPPPFECLYDGAASAVSQMCHGHQRCFVAVGDQNFKDPCPPQTRKYLSILYSCVPQTLLEEAERSAHQTTSGPTLDTVTVTGTTPTQPSYPAPAAWFSFSCPCSVIFFSYSGGIPNPKGSQLPESRRDLFSSSLTAYGYIKEHPETAGLFFTSSVCVGLLITLLALSVTRSRRGGAELESSAGEDEEDVDESGTMMDHWLLWEADRKSLHRREDVSEAAELMERMERRELIMQEIWMNAYLNGTSYGLL